MNEKISLPTTEEEKQDYNSFLSDPLKYPQYFFKNILKFKIEYLKEIQAKSMSEIWTEITPNNISTLIGTRILCRISMKEKKYFNRVAYDHFLIEA